MDKIKKDALLSVRHLTVEYTSEGEVIHAVNDVSFELEKGKTIGLVGETGAGKTSIAKAILRILPEPPARVKSGEIWFEGRELLGLKEEEMRKIRGKEICMILQDPMTSLNPLKTIGAQIGEAIRLHQGLRGKELKEAVLQIMRDVRIDDPERRYKQYPHEFSGGMRQRVVIAIAIACKPKILICDEPTTALDVTFQAQVLYLLKELKAKYNLTVIFITHDLGVVANIADRVAVMYAGDIVEIGLAEEIFYDPKHPYTWALLSSLPQLGIKGEELFSIKGTPPNLFTPIHGDAFAARNPQALKIDFVERPPYFEVSPTHKAKTWLLDPRAPKVEPPESIRKLNSEGATAHE